MKLPLEGGCLCGAIRYQISAEPRSADYCHWSMCRRAAGAPVVARVTVANGSFAWTTGKMTQAHEEHREELPAVAARVSGIRRSQLTAREKSQIRANGSGRPEAHP